MSCAASLVEEAISQTEVWRCKDQMNSASTQHLVRLTHATITEVLTEMDGELAVLEQRREKTHALRQGMMQQLLTGRIRLV